MVGSSFIYSVKQGKDNYSSNYSLSVIHPRLPIFVIIAHPLFCHPREGEDPSWKYTRYYKLVGLLFIIIGNYMGKLKSNWFIGMRNPWTLSSEEVWNKTNRLSGKLFILGGVLMILEAFVADLIKLPLFILIILILILVPNIYSYILYRQEKHKK